MVSQDLEGPYMDSSIPWFLVVEALGHMPQVDISLLLELVQKIPDISDELGRNAREMVSLRILERLHARGTRNKTNNMPSPASQIEIDPSDSCEDAVHRILQRASATGLGVCGSEILNWDIHSFILQKRSRLPNCSLQQLKNEILAGRNPLLALLKDRSGLEDRDETQSGNSIDGGQSNGIPHALSIITEAVENPQAKSPDRNLLPAKRDRGATTAETCEAQSPKFCKTYELRSKKLKQDYPYLSNGSHEILRSADQQVQSKDLSARSVDHIQEQENLEIGPGIQHMEEGGGDEDHSGEDNATTRLIGKDDEDPIELLPCQQLVPYICSSISRTSGEGGDQDNVPNIGDNECPIELLPCQQLVPYICSSIPGTSGDGGDQDNFSNKGDNECPVEPIAVTDDVRGVTLEENGSAEANDKIDGDFQNAANNIETQDNEEQSGETKVASDDDDCHYERTVIARKKKDFLSSQGTCTPDSLETQLSVCAKCNKDGNLLVCSSNSCPLAVHNNCLGFAADIDGRGNFYCPFCAYSRAISHYLEAKKKASLARNDLRVFMGCRTEQEVKKTTKRVHRSKQNPLCESENVHHNNGMKRNLDSLNENNRPSIPLGKSYRQVKEPSKSCFSDDPPCREDEADINNEPLNVPETVCQSPRAEGRKQPAGYMVYYNSRSRDPEMNHGSERPNQISEQKRVIHLSQSDPTTETSRADTDAKETSEAESENTVTRYTIRSRKQGRQIMDPPIPHLRRRKLPWTEVEEETLKEGVRRFSTDVDLFIPWKTILEFGREVFQNRRNAVDLKDKWRNICKQMARPK